MLPLLASPAFGKFKKLNMVATKLTEASTEPFVHFISEQFPDNRQLNIDLRLQNIRKMDRRTKIDPLTDFRTALTRAKKTRLLTNFILRI